MRFSTAVALAVIVASVPSYSLPLNTRRAHGEGNHLENAKNVAGIADGLSGVASNIYGATQARALEARKGGNAGKHLENANNVAGIADGLTGVATNIYRCLGDID